MAGQTIVTGVTAPVPPSSPDIPPRIGGFPGGIIDFFNIIGAIIAYIFTNIFYFFQLMQASPAFGTFGMVIFTPFVICLIWIILEYVKPAGTGS